MNIERERALNHAMKIMLIPRFAMRGTAVIVVDTRQPKVQVPLEHMNYKERFFKLSTSEHQSIEYNDHGIHASMLFGTSTIRYRCFFPWDSIVGVVEESTKDGWGFLKPPEPKKS